MSSRSATLAQVVAEALAQQMREGLYSCGERLVELTIAAEMNVSQNTVREALALLEQSGWVIKRPRHGVKVRSFTADEAEELYALRAALERLALGWALPNMTEMHKIELAQLISEARLHVNAMNLQGLRDTLFRFHAAIVSHADKPQTTAMLAALWNQTRLLENLRAEHDPHSLDNYAEMLTDYGELITHIRYNYQNAAQTTLHDIIMDGCHTLLPVLDLVG